MVMGKIEQSHAEGAMTEECYCPRSSNPDILEVAKLRFGVKWPHMGTPVYEFAWAGDGTTDGNNNGMHELDCSHMVNDAINTAFGRGCTHVPYMNRHYFNPPSGWENLPIIRQYHLNKWPQRQMERDKYFCKIDDWNEVGPGDKHSGKGSGLASCLLSRWTILLTVE
jgi:hypothetical protein